MNHPHLHRWEQVIPDATAEFPKNYTAEPVKISGTAYGCACGCWEFQVLPGWQRVRVTAPPECKFKTTHRKTEESKT